MARKLNELQSLTNPQNTDIYLTQSSGIDQSISFGDLKAAILNEVFTIGFIYTQYPGKPSPGDMNWPGTWTNVSSEYAGNFFRAEGGNASAFESGVQPATEVGNEVTYAHGANIRNGDEEVVGVNTSIYQVANNASYTMEWYKTRPDNETVRIWERTT